MGDYKLVALHTKLCDYKLVALKHYIEAVIAYGTLIPRLATAGAPLPTLAASRMNRHFGGSVCADRQ